MIRWSGVFVLAACASMSHAAEPAGGTAPVILAHRGGAHEYEENTMAAFRASYERGVRGFETDVRMTRDGSFVILHDDSLDRTHSGKGAVENQTAAELKSVTSKNGEPLLFLEDLLQYFADKPGCYIELEMKTGNKALYPDDRIAEYCKKLVAQVEAQRPPSSAYVYCSFDERPLKAVHAINPKAPMSLITAKPCTTELIQQAKSVGADRIACQLKGTSRAAVEAAHKAGLLVNAWPGHTIEDYYLALGLGLDVHCTDIPTAVQAVKEKLR